MKKSHLREKLVYVLVEIVYFLIMFFYLDFVHEKIAVSSVFDEELFSVIVLLFLIITGFLGPWLNKVIGCIFASFFSLYVITQSIYYRAFDQYYRFNTVHDLFSDLIGVKESAFEFVTIKDVMPLIVLLLISILFLVLFFVFQRKKMPFIYKLILQETLIVLYKNCY